MSILLDRRDLSSLDTVVARNKEEAHPHFRSCLAPECDAGQIHDNSSDPLVVCYACGAESCFDRRIAWHVGLTCGAFDDSRPDAVSLKTSEERVKAVAKKYPGPGSVFYVEKDGGCDDMYCSKCQTNRVWGNVKFDELAK